MKSTTRKPSAVSIRPHVKLWIEAGGESILCRGLSCILQAVEETGSIKEAAAHVGRSYRFVWARIKQAERAFGATLVETHVGGRGTRRSELSPLAQDLLRDFDQLCQQVRRVADDAFEQQMKATLRRHGCRPSG